MPTIKFRALSPLSLCQPSLYLWQHEQDSQVAEARCSRKAVNCYCNYTFLLQEEKKKQLMPFFFSRKLLEMLPEDPLQTICMHHLPDQISSKHIFFLSKRDQGFPLFPAGALLKPVLPSYSQVPSSPSQ